MTTITRVRQSDLQSFSRCPLAWRFSRLDNVPGVQMSASTWGTIIHDVVLWMEVNQDPDGAVARFRLLWENPTRLDPALEITEWIRGDSYAKLRDLGVKILQDWWELIRWDGDVVIAREHHFVVPFADGVELEGTVDKVALRYDPKVGGDTVLISDYKTSRKQPTYGYLNHNLQFSMYAYASTRPEFWAGIDGGMDLYERFLDLPRRAEWVHLRGTKRMDAGPRDEGHYARLKYAIEAFVQSVALRIFVPNISGDTCAWCEFREHCGLPSREQEGLN